MSSQISSIRAPVGSDTFANSKSAPDLRDRVTDAYYGKKGEKFAQLTRARIHWMCAHVHGKRVLDVGCSQGITAILLGREGRKVVGIDLSPQAIGEAKQHLSREPSWIQDNIEFWNGDFLTSGLESQTFDTVILGEILEHLTQPEAFVDAAANMLAEGGRLIVTVPFGINDWPDHKQTFYLFQPWRLLSRRFDLEEVKIIGKWIGFVARARGSVRADGDGRPGADHLASCETAFHEIERGLTDSRNALANDLKALQAKHDGLTEEHRTLKERVAQSEAARQKAEQERDAATREREEAEQGLEQAQAEIRDARRELAEATTAAQSAVAARDERIRELGDLLAQAREAGRGAQSDQTAIAALLAGRDARIAELQSDAGTLSEALARERSAHAWNLDDERTASRMALAERDARLSQLQADMEASAEAFAAAQSSLTEASARQRGAEAYAEELSGRLIKALDDRRARSDEMAAMRADVDTLQREAGEARREVARAVAERDAVRGEVESIRAQLKAAETRIAAAVKTKNANEAQARKLTGDLDAARKTAADERKAGEQLKRQLQEATSRTMTLRTQVDSLQKQKVAAEQQAAKVKQTISFQLGYALLHAGQSWRTTVGLPRTIAKLLREGKEREKKKIARSAPISKPPPAKPTPTPAAPSESRDRPKREVSFALTDNKCLKDLRIACVMDEFSYACFADEASFHQLTPEGWKKELADIKPNMLFIESAWRGKDELWGNRIGRKSDELVDIMKWCNAQGVPTAFWNKEDPVHFETFLNTAELFDFVFTTDLDCISRYKAALRHDRVYLLPFACQPARFNPIKIGERSEAICFAGAYYARYPERNRDLEGFIAAMAGRLKVEIYDRNFGKDDARYKFPDDYAPFIVGNLPFDKIEKAYKGYHYAINMNSVKQSQSMFARRVYELLASNTIIASNFARGLRLLFGDLVVCSDNGDEIVARLDGIGDGETRRKFTLLGLRKVMSEHTAEDRLAYAVSKVQNRPVPPLLPKIAVVGYASSKSALTSLIDSYRRQTYSRKELIIVAGANVDIAEAKPDDVRLISEASIGATTMGQLVADATRVVGMSPEDYYGPNYVCDLVLATRYADAPLIGKASHYVSVDGQTPELIGADEQYTSVPRLQARCAMVDVNLIKDQTASKWLIEIEKNVIGAAGISIDEFNYCRAGVGLDSERRRRVDDLEGIDRGANFADVIRIAEDARPEPPRFDGQATIVGSEFAKWFRNPSNDALQFNVQGGALRITSSLDSGKHDYVYSTVDLKPSELDFHGIAKVHLEATPGLNIQIALVFLEKDKKRISHHMVVANSNATCEVPPATAFVRIGIRIFGSGEAEILRLIKGHATLSQGVVVSKARHLVLTNLYPEYGDLYRNAFVHSRVRAYKRRGVDADVFRLRPHSVSGFYEFKGIDIMNGSSEALERLLSGREYESIAVHFLDEPMWRAIERCCPKTKVVVWLHGSEVQPWWRRAHNYITESEREAAKGLSEKRTAFWRQLMADLPSNLHFVFVSEYFAGEVMSDLGVQISRDRYSIVHNPIDTSLFEYRPKDAESRKKILSIRPFASRQYANDLTCSAILALKSRSFFNDLEFRLIGDGPLFEQVVRPLRGLHNVHIEQRFLTQDEIARMHAEHGIFLVPTRWDSHGVSRDEAMASGLVPVTSNIAAIPEFVDEDCGRLAAPDDADGLARAITELYENPETFLRLSAAAAARVRRQSDVGLMIGKELSLLTGP